MNDEDINRTERLKNHPNVYIISSQYHKDDACGKVTKDTNEWLTYNACKETDSLDTIITKINRGSKCVSLRKDVWFLKHLTLYPLQSHIDSNHRAELNRTISNLEECKQLYNFKINEQNKDTVKLIIKNHKLTEKLGKLLNNN